MVASLGLLLGVAHVPAESSSPRLGWHRAFRHDRALVGRLDVQYARKVEPAAASEPGAPITRVRKPERRERNEARRDTWTSLDPPDDDRPNHLSGLSVMSAAPQMPRILGGPGALYLHIEYPRQAVRDRIEGRLLLSFIVDTEGRTGDVRVIESLHPACDSAAVAALRKTRFVPGRREGEPVAMRMRLPVRFRLVAP